MKFRMLSVFLLSALLLTVFAIVQLRAQQSSSKAAPAASNWKAVDDAMGRAGQDQPDGAHRFNMPRSDLKVTANGVEIKPGFALGSWAASRWWVVTVMSWAISCLSRANSDLSCRSLSIQESRSPPCITT